MIILTRLGGGMPVAVNPDLIERAEQTPDTVLTMVDGHKFVVSEPLDEVVELVRAWRASVAADAYRLTHTRLPVASSQAELAEVTEHAQVEASVARVFRLPQREG